MHIKFKYLFVCLSAISFVHTERQLKRWRLENPLWFILVPLTKSLRKIIIYNQKFVQNLKKTVEFKKSCL